MSLSPVESDSGDGDIVAEINVTPLTDIFLVLLIIFMVTSTALTQQGTKVNLPRAGAGGAETAGVTITATVDHRIEINGKAVTLDDLKTTLEAIFQKGPERNVILQGDRNVVLEQAVQIMTIAKEAGAEKIAIATAPPGKKILSVEFRVMSTAKGKQPQPTPVPTGNGENRSAAPESRSLKTLRDIIESGRPLTYIRSAEEHRIGELLRQAATTFFRPPVSVWTWSLTEGMRRDDDGAAEPMAPRAALDFIAAHEQSAIFHLKDFHDPMRESGEVRRRLRDLYGACFDRGKFVVISSPVKFVPEELEREMVYFELNVPDLVELVEFLRREAESLISTGHAVDTSDGTLLQLGRALQGLTLDESRHAVRRAVAQRQTLDAQSVPALHQEKKLLVNRTGMIEYVADASGIEAIGGLETMKQWLMERRKLFLMRDQVSAEIVPKGVLVMGISGCGKSLSVKAIASCFELPLYRIDMIEIFSGRHGKPEGAFVGACRMLEDMAPAVVWFDEIEAGISTQSKEGDLGRIFGFFLTWMQEKARGLFVGATANRIDLLPAEMIRKGRFDEVFFVDLPTDDERVEVFKVHLLRRGVDPSGFNIDRLKRFTKGWTGAEVEQCVISAMTAARLDDRDVVDDDLLNVASTIVPLSKTMKEQVDLIRAWAYDRAVRASPRDMGR